MVINKTILATLTLSCSVMMQAAYANSTCPIESAAIISTAGDENGRGSLSQSFVIPPGYETIAGAVAFLSNEWPRFYGTQFNDTYLARFSAPGLISILASGNVNSSSWKTGTLGYNGIAPVKSYTLDASGLAGRTATLKYEVNDVGDLVVDSALAIDQVKVVRTEQFVHAGSGFFTSPGAIQGSFGQAVRLTFTNTNVLGATLKVTNNGFGGGTRGSIVLPGQSVTYEYYSGGVEPTYWSFDVDTTSDAFFMDYSIESTWVEGMPVNPCY